MTPAAPRADPAALAARLVALGLAPEAAEAVAASARTARLRRGARVFSPGEEAGWWLLVLSGRVRVFLVAETGREITLYRVGPGEPCVLTTSCILARTPQSAEAVCEEDCEAALVEAGAFRRLLGSSEAFRDAALAAYAARMADLVHVLEDTVFHALPQRLARAILARADARGRAAATHRDLAAELGAAREAITRTLAGFARDGLVALARGAIEIRDRERLSALAAGPGSP